MSRFILPEAGESNSRRKESRSKKNSGTPGDFKLESQQIMITYSQCDIEPSEFLPFFEKVVEEWGLDTYIIAQESHKDGGKHIHAYLKLKRKPHKNNASKLFDYKGFHPNFSGCRSWKATIKYVTKDGKYIHNLDEEQLRKIILENTKVGEIYERCYKKTIEESVEAGMKELETTKTFRDLVVHGESIERSLKRLRRDDNNVTYKMEDFKPLQFEWNRRKTLVMTGPSDTGKTSLALAMLPRCLFVSDLDSLRDYNSGKYEGIVFDDMAFNPDPVTGRGGLTREQQIALFDMDQPRQIKCRYNNAKIPANTPKIVTSNLHIDNICFFTDDAIKKRVQHVEIKQRTYLEPNNSVCTTPTGSTTTTTTTSSGTRMSHEEFMRVNGFLDE